MRTGGAGFTLLELLVVLAVMGLITAMAMPSLSGAGDARRLDNDAARIGAALAEARGLSRRTGRESMLTIDVGRSAILLPGREEWTGLGDGLTLEVRTAAMDVADSARATVRFFPDGSSTGASIRLTGGGGVRLIIVDWLTGRIDVDARPPA